MNLKTKLVKELKTLDIPGVLSLSVIGSFITKKKLSGVEDADIYLIVDEMNPKMFKQIRDGFERIRKALATKDIVCVTEYRAGPFKPGFVKGKKVIQLHILINTLDMLANKSNMVALDWKLSNIRIQGKKVSEFLKVGSFSRSELIDGRDGLLYFMDLIKEGKKAWREWATENGDLVRIKHEEKIASRADWLELLQFVVIQGFTNFVRLSEPDFAKTEQNIMKKAKKMLPPEHFSFLSQILKMKNIMKEKGAVQFDLKKTKGKSYSFIKYLINQAK